MADRRDTDSPGLLSGTLKLIQSSLTKVITVYSPAWQTLSQFTVQPDKRYRSLQSSLTNVIAVYSPAWQRLSQFTVQPDKSYRSLQSSLTKVITVYSPAWQRLSQFTVQLDKGYHSLQPSLTKVISLQSRSYGSFQELQYKKIRHLLRQDASLIPLNTLGFALKQFHVPLPI